MSTPSHDSIPAKVLHDTAWPLPQVSAWIKRHSTPYHLTIAAVLGLVSVGFAALIGVLLIIALNFNVLGWIE